MGRLRAYAYDWIAALGLAAVPAIIFWQSATSLAEQDAASGGPLRNAALFPRMVAVMMAVLLVWQLGRIALGRLAAPSPMGRAEGTVLALAATGLFVVYLVVLPLAGFHLATPVLSALLFVLFGIAPLLAVAGGAALSLVTAFVFEGLLNVVLPVGAFNITLFS